MRAVTLIVSILMIYFASSGKLIQIIDAVQAAAEKPGK